MRVSVYARFDMTVHHLRSTGECAALDPPALYSDLLRRLTSMHYPDSQRSSHGYADFTHIMSGYDAGYYSYLRWAAFRYCPLRLVVASGQLTSRSTSAQVFAADLFETHFAPNPRDQDAWERYRIGVLEPGGSRDELEMLEEFLGHAPSPRALLGSFDSAS